MATLKDVAKLAHVNISTVSRALNNSSYVHPETKERIMKAVRELSYQPNILARGLRQGKLYTIAAIMPMLSFSVFDEIVSGIELAARENGYATIIVNTGGNEKVEKESLEKLRNGFVDGIVIAGTGANHRLIRDINSEIPIVQVIRKLDERISSVIVDYEDIGYKATRHLIDNGCRNIGLINGAMSISPYAQRYEGYMRAIKRAKLKEITAERESMLRGMKYGYDCALQLLSENKELDAILAATDAQGMGVLRALRDQKKKVPKDIRVVSMTGHRVGDMLENSLTSVELPCMQIGERAARLLLDEIRSGEDIKSPVHHLQFDATLIERESG